MAVPPTLPLAQHAKHVATLVSTIAPLIVGGGGAAITAAWAIWNFLKKRAEPGGRPGVEVVEEQSAVIQSLARVSNMLRLFEDTFCLRNTRADLDNFADVEKGLLQEEAVDTGILTTEQVAQIDQVIVNLACCVNIDGLLNMLDCSTSSIRHLSRRHVHQRGAFRCRPVSPWAAFKYKAATI